MPPSRILTPASSTRASATLRSLGGIEGVLGSAGEVFAPFEDLIELGGLQTTPVDGGIAGTWLGGLVSGDGWRSLVEE